MSKFRNSLISFSLLTLTFEVNTWEAILTTHSIHHKVFMVTLVGKATIKILEHLKVSKQEQALSIKWITRVFSTTIINTITTFTIMKTMKRIQLLLLTIGQFIQKEMLLIKTFIILQMLSMVQTSMDSMAKEWYLAIMPLMALLLIYSSQTRIKSIMALVIRWTTLKESCLMAI